MIEPHGERGVVDVGGVRLSHLVYGAGDDVIVVVPGITSPAITWEFVADELADAYRVVVLDVRGRGLSDRPVDGYTLPGYADDVAAVLAALGLERPAILGHSMGGRIAMALGALHPDACGPLVIVDPPVTGPGRAGYPTPIESFQLQLEEGYRGTTVDEIRRFYPRWPERELQVRCDWLPTCDEHAVLETYRNFDVEDVFGYWDALRPPLLLVYGEESPVIPLAEREELARRNPAARIVGTPRAGHMIPWENLDDFVAQVRGFLADAR